MHTIGVNRNVLMPVCIWYINRSICYTCIQVCSKVSPILTVISTLMVVVCACDEECFEIKLTNTQRPHVASSEIYPCIVQ